MNLSAALLTALKERGATTIFGIPGDFALPFFKQIEELNILPLATLSHEPSVGFAADAAARLTGLGVAAVTYGAGALNMVNAVSCAYAESSPLVIISGAPSLKEKQSTWSLHHQVKNLDSQFNIYKEITCAQCRLDDIKTAAAEIARVLDACRHYSKPVFIEIPRDQVAVECEKAPPVKDYPYQIEAVSSCAQLMIERIKSAKSPVLLIDVEVKRFGAEENVAKLAKCLDIPVVTTFMGRGLLAKADVTGVYLGAAGDREITDLVEQSDCLIMLGAILSDTNFNLAKEKIDLHKAIVAHEYKVMFGYSQFMNIPLFALIEALLEQSASLCINNIDAAKDRDNKQLVFVNDNEKISPMDIVAGLKDFIQTPERNYPIASDIGDCLFSAMSLPFNIQIIAPAYYATMGFGVPAGMGIQLATGLRPIILVGDGAFQMTGWELGNCKRLGINPIVIVFNNKSWEMLRVFQPESKFNKLDDWNFAAIANNLHGFGVRVETRSEFKLALDTAYEQSNFSLIEVMLEPGTLSDTLRNFVNTVKKAH